MWVKESIQHSNEVVDIDRYERELCNRLSDKSIDAFCSYCLGRIWVRTNDKRSTSVFIESINRYSLIHFDSTRFPYFWSCWVELSSVILDTQSFQDTVKGINSQFFLKYFFQLYTTNRLLTVFLFPLYYVVQSPDQSL